MNINNLIEPKVFAPFVREAIIKKSPFIKSGAVNNNEVLARLASGGGRTVTMPYWARVSGDSEVLSTTTPLTPARLVSGADTAAIHYRGKTWGASELYSNLAGDSGLEAAADMVADFWVKDEQKLLVASLAGVFGSAGMEGHVFGRTNPAALHAEMVLDAKQLLGDAFGQLHAIVMHSAVYTSLQKQDLITFMRPSEGARMGEYLGYNVVVDDSIQFDAGTGVYSTYLLAEGVIGRGDGCPVDFTHVETSRDSLKGEDYLTCRKALILHPFGVAFTSETVAGISPTITELRNPLNWNRVYEPKNIGMIEIRHTIQ